VLTMLNSGHSLHFFFAFCEVEQEPINMDKTNNEIIKRSFLGLLIWNWGFDSFSKENTFG
jgi:hypothetical protein